VIWAVIIPTGILCLCWVALSVRLARNLFKLRQLCDVAPPGGPLPRVSVVVAARNEEAGIEPALRSLCALDYPDLEIVAVDDRSTDRTGAIIARLAEEFPRLRPLTVERLPDRWLGKPHALQRGVERATGDWLLFTDADVHFEPSSVARALALGDGEDFDHVVAFPDLDTDSFWLKVAAGTFGGQFLGSLRLEKLADRTSPHCVGVGAFNLVRRETYERTPGFEWLRMEVADDLGLAWMIKAAGGRTIAVGGRGMLRLAWYANVTELIRGFEKNTFGAVAGYRLHRALIAALGMVAYAVAPVAAVLLPLGPWMATAGVAAYAGSIGCAWIGSRKFDLEFAPGFFAPIGLLFLAWALARSGLVGWWRGGISWRGTRYPLRELRRGQRVRLWGAVQRVKT
jgi:hypothetical protein